MDIQNKKTILYAGGGTIAALIACAFVVMVLQMQNASAQQHATLQLVAAQQTAQAAQIVAAHQQATITARQAAHVAAVATQQAAAQATVVAGQTATVVARDDQIGRQAATQETVVAAQAQDTAVADQAAQAKALATANAQETAVAIGQRVAAAQAAVARATASVPHDTPLGIWNNKCVVQSIYSDETVTWDSDNTWAQSVCGNWLAAYSTYVSFPTNNARPGAIQCAFIHTYSGTWLQFYDYAGPPSGDAQIAVRSSYWSDASSDCARIAAWTDQQNANT